MVLLIFSYLIIIANFLFFLIGFGNDIGVVGGFMGGLAAIGTDPVVLLLGALLGTGLVARSYKFSVIYLVIGAIFLTMLSHVILGTTKIIVDIARFDAYLIIPSLIIIVTSFFTPKTKSKIKYTELPIHRPIRILTLIFAAVMVWVIFLNEDKSERYYKNKTIFSKYVTKYIISNTAFADRKVGWCMKTNEPSAGFKMKNYDHSNLKMRELRAAHLVIMKKNECKLIHEEIIIVNLGVTKEEINKLIKDGKTYTSYNWNYDRVLWRRVTDWTAALIAMVAVWKLRFCIAFVITRPMFTPNPKPTKSDFNLAKIIKDFIKKI